MANTCAGCGKTIEWDVHPLFARWVNRRTTRHSLLPYGDPQHPIEANGRLVGDQDHFTSSDEVPSIDFLSPMHQDLFDSV